MRKSHQNGSRARSAPKPTAALPAQLRAVLDRHGPLYVCAGGRVVWRNEAAISAGPPACERHRASCDGQPDEQVDRLRALDASEREIDIFLAKRTGAKLAVAAEQAHMSMRTASAHLTSLFRRLNVHSFVELLSKVTR